ncbi:unnamed protein product [Closterium sp. NIES-64]|nr:unnamed protein product [Closterium sp. NIES-64]
MRHPLRNLPSLLVRFGAIPKPVEGSNDPLEWEEWPGGNEAAVKFHVNRKERCFGLGIAEERGDEAENLTQHPPQHTSEARGSCRRVKKEGARQEAEQRRAHLLWRVLFVFPPCSPGRGELVDCLDLPACVPRPLNLHMLLTRAEQVPLYFLLHMALWCAQPLLDRCEFMGYDDIGKGQGVGSGASEEDEKKGGNADRVEVQDH